MSDYDQIYSKPQNQIGDFTFNKEVTNVFDNMIRRSVPGYETIVKMIGIMAKKYAQEESKCYELGCSLGTTAIEIARNTSPNIAIIAVDSSASMVEKCKVNVQNYNNISVEQADVCDVEISGASVVSLNFTLQFVPREKRQALLQKIYDGMLPGGILLLSEKITYPDRKTDELQTNLHHNFKRFEGYSDIEIEQKKSALKNVMLIDSLPVHQERLQQVGFRYNETWYQCFNFVSIFAQKI